MNRTIAALTYTVLRSYRMALGEVGGPAWEAAPEATKLKATLAVDWVREQKDPPTAEALHKRWTSAKLIDGWSQGPRSDVMKMHPHLIPFEKMAAPQQAKGELALSLIHVLAPLAKALDKAEAEVKAIAEQQLAEQAGALLYIAAMVGRFGGETGIVHLTKADMEAALSLELSRHDANDGSLVLKVERLAPEAANDPKVLDTALPPGG